MHHRFNGAMHHRFNGAMHHCFRDAARGCGDGPRFARETLQVDTVLTDRSTPR